MESLWRSQCETVSVRDVVDDLVPERHVAYTTVMTVMDRLAKKGLLERKLVGRAWQYSAKFTRVEFFAEEILAIMQTVSSNDQMEIVARLHYRLMGEAAPELRTVG